MGNRESEWRPAHLHVGAAEAELELVLAEQLGMGGPDALALAGAPLQRLARRAELQLVASRPDEPFVVVAPPCRPRNVLIEPSDCPQHGWTSMPGVWM